MASESSASNPGTTAAPRPRFVPVVGPRLKLLLAVVFGLFALLGVNSTYLAAITFMEWRTGAEYQNYFYLLMFAAHIAMGLAITVPVVVFGIAHARNASNRPNKWAKRIGWSLFIVAIVLLVTGFALTRMDVGGVTINVKDPAKRAIIYWLHVIAPLVAIWLFVLHRMAGRRIKWRIGIGWGFVGAAAAIGMAAFHSLDPRRPNQPGPKTGAEYFEPSLARTATGKFIPAERLMMNEYCLECHPDTYDTWAHSMHAISSFNNPFYAFSVLETRKRGFEHDGNVRDARFCAACHDPVPFFSGAFDDPKWDDPNYEIAKDPLGKASITCTSCHSIVHVDGTRGNGEYTIEESQHYPFVDSESPFLRWVNRQLIKAKPAFHARTFLKPNVHKTDEFCSTCHKVNLPAEINDYKWLRGQNHYDSFRLSGVSGHGVVSWYYPPKAENDCNGCHMPAVDSGDFGAKMRDGRLTVKDHMFVSANTAVHHVLDMPEGKAMIEAVEAFNRGVMRVDIMGIHEGDEIDAPLVAPLRPEMLAVARGNRYLLDVVTRTLKMGHEFTQGTADSNEVWMDVKVTHGDRIIGRSGGLGRDGEVDPWSKFFNVFMLDREGNRIDRRNPQDIFVPLYNNQIPPGAADLTQFVLDVPSDLPEGGPSEIAVEVSLRYRKFDTTYMKYVFGPDRENDLPILTLATDRVTLPLSAGGAAASPGSRVAASEIPEWQRWYDYGIGLFRTADRGMGKGQLRQAEAAFQRLAQLKRPEGPLGLARLYLREGRIDEAVIALEHAASHDPPAYPWSVAWFSGLVAKQQGNLGEAADFFRQVIATPWPLAKERGFDFSRDDRVRVELAETLLELSRVGGDRGERGDALLAEAESHLLSALKEDTELASAHYLLSQVYEMRGDTVLASKHRGLHLTYRPDDNAMDRAVNAARIRYPAANKAAEAVVLYELRRPGAYELPETSGAADSVALRESDSGRIETQGQR